MKKNDEDGTFIQIDDKEARQKISHALRYRKQNKSEPSLMLTAVKKPRSNSDSSSFPRLCSTSSLHDFPMVAATKSRKRTTTKDHGERSLVSIFSDEELASVAPNDLDYPSSFASFQFHSQQDDWLEEEERANLYDET